MTIIPVLTEGCGEIIIFIDYVKGSEDGAMVFPHVLKPGEDPDEITSLYPLVNFDSFLVFGAMELMPITRSFKGAVHVRVPKGSSTIYVIADIGAGDGTLEVSAYPVRVPSPYDMPSEE